MVVPSLPDPVRVAVEQDVAQLSEACCRPAGWPVCCDSCWKACGYGDNSHVGFRYELTTSTRHYVAVSVHYFLCALFRMCSWLYCAVHAIIWKLR